MRIPPGITSSTFSAALDKAANVVGKQWVFTSDEDLDLYRDGYSILWNEPDERMASAAIAPASVEEVRAVVKIANEYKIPLYAISTGRNLGYGGSAPAYSGCVVLDLKRMNKVLEINEELHYCIVEPGVSFFDLWAELRKRNLRLRASQPAPGWGSPIGNALDHGRGGPAGDNFRNSCGMEVVLGDGSLMRTGMGALPNAKTWPTYNNGVGPSFDGIFAQSNFGIITKMGFNLFAWPETIRRIRVTTRNYDDLDELVHTCNAIEAQGVGSMAAIFSPLAWLQTPDVVELLTKRGGGTAAQFNQLAKDKDADLYLTGFSFSGPEKVTQAQFEYARDAFAKIPGLKITGGDAVYAPSDISKLNDDQAAEFGKPNLQRFWTDTAQFSWDGHFWFSPLLPRTGAELRKAQQTLGDACRDMDTYWGWPDTLVYEKNFCIVKNVNVSKDDPAKNKKMREVMAHLIRVAADHGWSEYRTAPALQEAVMDTFSFNDHAYMRFCEKVKDAIDPNGVLSPGRYGIWPKQLRSR